MTSREALQRANPFAIRPQPKTKQSENSCRGLKPDGRAGLGKAFDQQLDNQDAGLLRTDAVARAGLATSSSGLLRAQLKAGQHVLELAQARVVALAIGLPPVHVRRGIGDATRFKLREAR